MFGIFNSKARAQRKTDAAFLTACENGGWVEAARLMSAGAQIEAADDAGDRALSRAAAAGQASVVKKLLDAGAEVDARNHNGETALFRAAASGALDSMRALIGRGASLTAANAEGLTPLGAAVLRVRFGAAELLLEKQVDANARIGGSSALAVA